MATGGGGLSGRYQRLPGVFRAFARSYAYFRASLGSTVEAITRAMTGGSYQVPGGSIVPFDNPRARRVATDASRIYNERFRDFMKGGGGSHLARAEHLRAETPHKFDTPYRYTVIATWESPTGNQQFRTYVNDASKIQTVADLENWVKGLAPRALGDDTGSPGLPSLVVTGWHVVNIDLVLAERRT